MFSSFSHKIENIKSTCYSYISSQQLSLPDTYAGHIHTININFKQQTLDVSMFKFLYVHSMHLFLIKSKQIATVRHEPSNKSREQHSKFPME